jgi:curved DNA-binding protein CbpA
MSGGRPPKFDPTINYYQILNVPVTATKAEITEAYRNLIRATHPDRFNGELERKKAEERAKLLNAAYAVLSKPDLRKQYDLSIRQNAVSDTLFQRYTGSSNGQSSPFSTRSGSVPPHLSKAQKRASRSAFLQLLLVTFIFAVIIMTVIVVGSVLAGGVDAFFS